MSVKLRIGVVSAPLLLLTNNFGDKKMKKDMRQVKVKSMPKGNGKNIVSYDERKMMVGNSAKPAPKPKKTK